MTITANDVENKEYGKCSSKLHFRCNRKESDTPYVLELRHDP